jgi:DNA-binding IclR family transcriptional regulator
VDQERTAVQEPENPESPELRVLRALASADAGLIVRDLRNRCKMRTQTVHHILQNLVEQQLVHRSAEGYRAEPDAISRFLSR